LVAAGALAFRDALPLVRFRAQAMQEAVPAGVGAMAAILGLDATAVAAVCAEAAGDPRFGQVVEPVNFNTPEQIVVAGHREAVERAIVVATAKGAKRGVLLPVSAPFHSSLLKPAGERLAAELAGVPIVVPGIPVLHNVDVAERPTVDAIRAALAQQASSPVRWVETIRAFAERGVTHVVECGPGRVLAGLNKRIARELKSFALTDGNDIASTKAALAG
jgi:[acyl-carrier-protein] S-malonyltransferase